MPGACFIHPCLGAWLHALRGRADSQARLGRRGRCAHCCRAAGAAARSLLGGGGDTGVAAGGGLSRGQVQELGGGGHRKLGGGWIARAPARPPTAVRSASHRDERPRLAPGNLSTSPRAPCFSSCAHCSVYGRRSGRSTINPYSPRLVAFYSCHTGRKGSSTIVHTRYAPLRTQTSPPRGPSCQIFDISGPPLPPPAFFAGQRQLAACAGR